MSEIAAMSMLALRDAIATGQVKASEAVDAFALRIETHDGELHAYNELLLEQAKAQAARVDAGEVKGELAGLPIAIKDNLCTTVGHTTCSSRMLQPYVSPFTATAVRKLEQAGALILGKTNLDEFAMGSSTENSAFGLSRNPWDTSRVPGGSSGGSAVAVAADLCSGALGSDTGGSIRQPAAFCGIVGLKPTYGRVSRYGLVAFASSLDQIGPMTKTVEDAALLVDVISGHDPLDSTSARMPHEPVLPVLNEKPATLRVGLAKQYLSDSNSPTVKAAVDRAIDIYREAGAEIVEVDLPHTEYGIAVYYLVATSEASSNLARYDGVHYGHRAQKVDDLIDLYAQSREEGFGEEVKRRIMLGTFALSSGYYDAYYNKALKVRRLIKQDFDQAFKRCDVILCPTVTDPAFKAGENADDPLAMYMNDVYTVTCNLAGLPGISVPAGTADVEGKALPVGIQLLAGHFQEKTLLQAARVYEAARGPMTKCPMG